MRDRLLTIVAAIVTAILYVSFMSALPEPFSHIHLPLLLILLHVNALRFNHALTAAIAAGITMDILSTYPFGAITLVLVIVTVGLIPLFTHVFTHRSVAAFIGLNILGYCAYQTLSLLVKAMRFWLSAYPLGILFTPERFMGFIGALVVHVVVGVVVLYVIRIITARFGSFMLVR